MCLEYAWYVYYCYVCYFFCFCCFLSPIESHAKLICNVRNQWSAHAESNLHILSCRFTFMQSCLYRRTQWSSCSFARSSLIPYIYIWSQELGRDLWKGILYEYAILRCARVDRGLDRTGKNVLVSVDIEAFVGTVHIGTRGSDVKEGISSTI